MENKSTFDLRSFTGTFLVVSVCALFCFFHYLAGGLHFIHFFYAAIYLALFFLHPATRVFCVIAIPFIVHNTVYDSFRYIPFDWLRPIHVGELYNLDKLLFSVTAGGKVVLFHEYLLRLSNQYLDLGLGLLYHTHNLCVVALLVILWRFKSIDLAQRFAAAFLLMNIFAFATYFFYPAAAPWYVAQHGMTAPLSPVFGNAAGLAHLDQMLGIHFSTKVYSLNPVVFGAVPSMHAGFTMLASLYAFHVNKKVGALFSAYALLIWFGALYLQHHYLVDVILGVVYAVAAYFLVEKFLVNAVRRVYQSLFALLIPARTEAGEEVLPGRTPKELET